MIRCTEGSNSKDRIAVLSNAMDIPVRLKEVNRDFFVMFNIKTQKYEIHCASQPDTTLACELPYEQLDARAIAYAREYSAARMEIIAAEVDRYNEQREESQRRELLDDANYRMRDVFNYLKNNSKTDEIPEEAKRE